MEKDNSLFLKLGAYNYRNQSGIHEFKLMNENSFLCKIVNYIVDPIYESTFDYLFGPEDGKKRLIDFINSIIFPNKEEKVTTIKYINNEFTKLNKKKCKNVIVTDIACQIEISNKNKPFLMTIELHIGKSDSFSKKIFENKSSKNDNFFKDSYFIGLYFSIYEEKNDSNNNNLIKTKNKSHKLKYTKIADIDIDINDKIKDIINNENVIINNKEIKINGKEYIKLLGIRNWCSSDSSKYILPKLSLLSSNDIFIECLEILGSISQSALSLMKVDEQSLLDEENEKRNREGIILSFAIFVSNLDPIEYLNKNDFDLKDYSEEDIKLVLKDQKEEYVNTFIEFLIKGDLIMSSEPNISNA